jgi:hypothetical protein
MGAKEDALALVDRFAAKTGAGQWKQILRREVAEQLKIRVNNPIFINQGTAGVCVPAAFVYGIAQEKPLEYATAVTDLYDTGLAYIGKLKLAPCYDLLCAPRPGGVEAADWVILSSIRDSENWFFDYESDKDSGGSTVSETKKWLERAGYTQIIVQETGRGERVTNLKQSMEYYKQEYQVMWRLNASCIDSGIEDDPEPNHRVVLAGEFVVPPRGSDPFHAPIWTWGQKITMPRAGGLKFDQFLAHYFGFIAAKF